MENYETHDTRERPSETFLEPVVPATTPLPARQQVTDAELYKYRYLTQLSVNARMRFDMYSAEVKRALADYQKYSDEAQAFLRGLSETYGLGGQPATVDDNGFLVPLALPK